MCTISLVALRAGGYLLADNRDERVTRGTASPPAIVTAAGTRYLAPRDSDGGGTWIAVDEQGRSLCLLNGDRPAADVPEPATAPSRGLLLLELMEAAEPDAVFAELSARREGGRLVSRPFKLLIVVPQASRVPPRVTRITWDGLALTRAELAAPHLETSNGFDPQGVARRRGEQFRGWLERCGPLAELPAPTSLASLRSALLEWHRSHAPDAPGGDLYSVCMHRPEVHTVSSTLVEVRDGRIAMRYQPGQPCANEPAVEVMLR